MRDVNQLMPGRKSSGGLKERFEVVAQVEGDFGAKQDRQLVDESRAVSRAYGGQLPLTARR